MNIISLTHARSLRYPVCREWLDTAALNVADPDHTTVVTFARTRLPARRLSALDRLLDVPAGDVVLSKFDTSPLSAQLLWDIAHGLPVGGRVYLHSSDTVAQLLTCTYYRNHFSAVASNKGELPCLKKNASLPAEADRGLDRWSFCIPTGDGDPAMLNACVARILALEVPEYEIILCGRPRADFRYWADVRVVGENITEPAVHITRKKNLLAAAARHPNLCILHDRVLLPLNFMDAVQYFGDDFPFTGFQSFWFADRWQAVPQRYSDAGVAAAVPAGDWPANDRVRLPHLAALPLRAKHPERADFGLEYLTGSLYLCKSSVWRHVPQNESLYWQEYEDLEQAFRGSQAGIPSRLNPFSLTWSLRLRSALMPLGMLTGESRQGVVKNQRSLMWLCGFPRRPSLTVTEKEARQRLAAFARRYTGDDRCIKEMRCNLNGIRRYVLIARLLWKARGDFSTLVADIHRDLLNESSVPGEEREWVALMEGKGSAAVRRLTLLTQPAFFRQLWNNPFSSPFLPESRDAGFYGGWRLWFGSLISALYLKFGCPHTVFRLSVWSLWRLLIRSAPVTTEERE